MIQLTEVRKYFGEKRALGPVSFEIEPGGAVGAQVPLVLHPGRRQGAPEHKSGQPANAGLHAEHRVREARRP